jgi:hypothetical protein
VEIWNELVTDIDDKEIKWQYRKKEPQARAVTNAEPTIKPKCLQSASAAIAESRFALTASVANAVTTTANQSNQ